ncbi:MAG: hypothetical protein EPO65_01485 [Dehalococcoidia bacterium]|nr:MAG: hypothetical protein EPO65_01485 [Dehalococcoidia bacterium]
MPEFKKPGPRPANEALTRPFWEAAQQHRFVVPQCVACDDFFWPPRAACPSCLREAWKWAEVSGRARLYSFTIVRQPANPAFLEGVPYVYALVDLEEGIRMVSNVVDCLLDDLQNEMSLVAMFEEMGDGWTLVKFRPARRQAR